RGVWEWSWKPSSACTGSPRRWLAGAGGWRTSTPACAAAASCSSEASGRWWSDSTTPKTPCSRARPREAACWSRPPPGPPPAQGACAYFTFAGSAPDEAAAEAAYEEAWRGTMEATLAHGGTISHHHGVGRVRAPWVRDEMMGWFAVWEAVRAALDPAGRMNPGALGGASP